MKQETLGEAAEKANGYNLYAKETKAPIFNEGFFEGAKWQAERMYSEADMEEAFTNGLNRSFDSDFDRWFKQFKKE